LAAVLQKPPMKNKHLIIIASILVLFAGLFALRVYNKSKHGHLTGNAEKNHDVMKYFVHDDEGYVRVAFDRLESEFKNQNDLKLDAFSVRKLDTILNGSEDTVYNVYFVYNLATNMANKYFSKVSVLRGKPTLELYNLNAKTSPEYLKIKFENGITERDVMRSLKESLQQIPDSTRKVIIDTIKKTLK
jgi:hypothetical protein